MKKLASKKNSGQALIEFSVAAAATLCLAMGGLSLVYYAWAKLWIRHVMYEALICQMEDASEETCKDALRAKVKSFLPMGTITKLRFNHSFQKTKGQIRFEITDKLWVGEGMTLKRPDRGGFVHFYILIPLALVLVVGFSLLSLILTTRAEQLQRCRHTLLKGAEHVEAGAEKLIELNPRILELQREREGLEDLLVAAGPQGAPAIQALIIKNQFSQVWMMGLQQKIKAQTLLSTAKEFSTLLDGNLYKEHIKVSRPRLVMERQLTHHFAKALDRPFHFSTMHRFNAEWTYNYSRFETVFKFPRGIARALKISCTVNIREERDQWYAQLAK